jgi:hypothetical protein
MQTPVRPSRREFDRSAAASQRLAWICRLAEPDAAVACASPSSVTSWASTVARSASAAMRVLVSSTTRGRSPRRDAAFGSGVFEPAGWPSRVAWQCGPFPATRPAGLVRRGRGRSSGRRAPARSPARHGPRRRGLLRPPCRTRVVSAECGPTDHPPKSQDQHHGASLVWRPRAFPGQPSCRPPRRVQGREAKFVALSFSRSCAGTECLDRPLRRSVHDIRTRAGPHKPLSCPARHPERHPGAARPAPAHIPPGRARRHTVASRGCADTPPRWWP